MKFITFKDKSGIEVMVNITNLSSINVEAYTAKFIVTNGGYYECELPSEYVNDQKKFIKQVFAAIRRAEVKNEQFYMIKIEDILTERV